MKKLRSNKASEKYFYKQEGFVCEIYLQSIIHETCIFVGRLKAEVS